MSYRFYFPDWVGILRLYSDLYKKIEEKDSLVSNISVQAEQKLEKNAATGCETPQMENVTIKKPQKAS